MEWLSVKQWSGITYPFPNFNCVTVEVWEWTGNFTSHFIMHVIIYSSLDWITSTLIKGTHAENKTVVKLIFKLYIWLQLH